MNNNIVQAPWLYTKVCLTTSLQLYYIVFITMLDQSLADANQINFEMISDVFVSNGFLGCT
jgi:hypothetical protein